MGGEHMLDNAKELRAIILGGKALEKKPFFKFYTNWTMSIINFFFLLFKINFKNDVFIGHCFKKI